MLAFLIPLILSGPCDAAPVGFVRASGTSIVDGSGAPLRLRGVNLGQWLLWENYLIRFEGHDLTESRMKRKVVDLVGRRDAFRFFRAMRENCVTRDDIRRVRELGFNCVRIPFNSRILSAEGHFDLEPGEGWKVLDRALDWCEAEGVYAILDMHSAPGGQNSGSISDNDMKAGLFDGPSTTRYREEAAELWGAIAKRYRSRTIVAAYDLLNEPVVEDRWGGGDALFAVTRQLVAAVRAKDPDHMIMIEGNWWSTSFGMFENAPPLDPGICYQFHKYWSPTGPDTVRYLVDLRGRMNAPFWLGETGENSAKWYARCIELMEESGFGWCFWPWKRIGGGCVQEVVHPDAWRRTSAALGDPEKHGGLSRREAVAGLDALAEALKLGNCREDGRVVDALFGRYSGTFRIPGPLEAAEYSRCRAREPGNAGGKHRAGDADIWEEDGRLSVRSMAAGDRLEWDTEVLADDVMRPVLRGASGPLTVTVDGTILPPAGRRIAAGRHVVAVESRADRGAVEAVTIMARPGRIEAEDFIPGEGRGYHDADAEDRGKKGRKGEGVDVQEAGEGGLAVGWIEKDEWLAWEIDVPREGKWDLVVRYAALGDGGEFSLLLDGAPLAGPVATPATGWWQNWSDLRVPAVALPAGRHILRLDAAKPGFNLDYFLFLPR